MTSTLSKIHVTNSTSLSLNDRFTAISNQPKVLANVGSGRRSRSRSVQRAVPMASSSEHFASKANKVLIAQFQRKHKLSAALKLKRRSMRTIGGGSFGNGNPRIRRGTVKAFRVGANGKPIRTNSLARIATMKADKESLNNRGRPLRRSESSGNLANRLGPRRPIAGGAAQRVAKRNLDRQRARIGGGSNFRGRGRNANSNNNGGRSRSRSRSRTRTQSGNLRNSSRTRSNSNNQLNNRSRSGNRFRNAIPNKPSATNIRRGRSRSRSRSRGRVAVGNNSNIPVKARLGVRPGAVANSGPNNRKRSASLTRRGVQVGRVQKRRNSTNASAPVSDNRGRRRTRSRSAQRNAARNVNVRSRSRSRTRRGQVVQQRQQQGSQMQRNGRAPRGRSLQRGGSANNNRQRRQNGNGKTQGQQQRRGRRGGSNVAGSRNQGNKTNATATKQSVNKDELDKELDQYMATTKTENEMDYLLKN